MELLKLIKEATHCVVFTGAGLSTDSGIPDFRSSSGLYLKGEFEGHTPEQILSRRFLWNNPKVFFAFYIQRILSMKDKQPNRAHFALAMFEAVGKIKCVVNQNIDNLLQKAGVKNVYDLHGNISTFRCSSVCGKSHYNTSEFEKIYKESSDGIPRCECGGIIRPNTVLFDEWLDDKIFDDSYHEIKKADLLIVIGSSLVVRPACMLIDELESNGKLVIMNKDSTPYDKKATLLIKEPCGQVLDEVVKAWV